MKKITLLFAVWSTFTLSVLSCKKDNNTQSSPPPNTASQYHWNGIYCCVSYVGYRECGPAHTQCQPQVLDTIGKKFMTFADSDPNIDTTHLLNGRIVWAHYIKRCNDISECK